MDILKPYYIHVFDKIIETILKQVVKRLFNEEKRGFVKEIV